MATFHYRVNDADYAVRIESTPDGFVVSIGDNEYAITLERAEANSLSFAVGDDRVQSFFSDLDENGSRKLWLDRNVWAIQKNDPSKKRRQGQSQSTGQHSAAMPGKVLDVFVQEGDMVEKGDLLATLEAMKMETRISASADGIVITVNCEQGEIVSRGQLLVSIDAS